MYRSKYVQYERVGILFGKDTYELSGEMGVTESKSCMTTELCEQIERQTFKKAKESSGRDGAAGVVLGGDRPKVMLALVEEPNAETEDWIWDTGAALDVASAAVVGKRQVSFAPLILSAGCVVNRHGEGGGAAL